MKITKIIIENFKSIQHIEFDVKKYGNSYTTMFLGINESGKSNILQAMSFFNVPNEEFDYNDMHNQKDEQKKPIDLWFYLSFEQVETYSSLIKKEILNDKIFNFKINSIVKHVYLQEGANHFEVEYTFNIEEITENIFIKELITNNVDGQNINSKSYEVSKFNDIQNTYVEFTKDVFKEYFENKIIDIIQKYEPQTSFWKPSDEYLITEVNLEEFKADVNKNKPLKNIFALAGYDTEDKIKKEIDSTSDFNLRRKLSTTLSDEATKYINNKWKHKIKIDIEITDSKKCNVSIVDDGKKNEHNFYKMNVRSEGFKQFMSLILSLSIETEKFRKKDKLIIIDEPEAHLHPSGIRDLKEQLLSIGKDNYVFISTHSPFLVDQKTKERNIIIRKNNAAITEKKEIRSEEDLRDDEVLELAFGINVYKDLLIPHRILVEGQSDKIILQKSLHLKGLQFGITNGIGSNIVQIATKFNYDDIKILVVTDDDLEGKGYRDKILKIAGVYDKNSVFTIRDLVASFKNEGTIEDLLEKDFVESKFKEFYKEEFLDDCVIMLTDAPFIEQIKIFLKKENKFNEIIIEKFKNKISDDFSPSKSAFEENFPSLKKLVEQIEIKLQS